LSFAFPWTLPCAASAIQLVQKNVNGNENATATMSVSFPSSNVAGDTLIVTGSAARPSTTLTVSDSAGNTYQTAMGPIHDPAQDVSTYVWYVPACKGGANKVTITPSVTAALEIHVSEWSGLGSGITVDQTSSATGNSTSVASGAKTTTADGELIFGYSWVFNTASAGTGLTALSLVNGDMDEYQIQAAAGSANATFRQSSAGTWLGQMATFKLASAPPPPPPPPPPSGSACDVNADGITNVVDVQLEVNMALGSTTCAADLNKDGLCTVVDVQRVVNAALGQKCVVGP